MPRRTSRRGVSSSTISTFPRRIAKFDLSQLSGTSTRPWSARQQEERDMYAIIGNHADLVFAAMIALFAVVMIGISVEDALHRR